jgi:hypothetical protein
MMATWTQCRISRLLETITSMWVDYERMGGEILIPKGWLETNEENSKRRSEIKGETLAEIKDSHLSEHNEEESGFWDWPSHASSAIAGRWKKKENEELSVLRVFPAYSSCMIGGGWKRKGKEEMNDEKNKELKETFEIWKIIMWRVSQVMKKMIYP